MHNLKVKSWLQTTQSLESVRDALLFLFVYFFLICLGEVDMLNNPSVENLHRFDRQSFHIFMYSDYTIFAEQKVNDSCRPRAWSWSITREFGFLFLVINGICFNGIVL